MNGNAVKGPKELSEMIAKIEPGSKVTVTVMREGSEHDINVTLGNLNDFDKQQQTSSNEEQPAAPTRARLACTRSA